MFIIDYIRNNFPKEVCHALIVLKSWLEMSFLKLFSYFTREKTLQLDISSPNIYLI